MASAYERIQSGHLSKQQIETEKQRIKNLKQEINESKSRVRLNEARDEQQQKETKFYTDTYDDRMETIKLDNKYKDLQTIPKTLTEVLIRTKVGRTVVSKLEDGKPLSKSEIQYLRSLSFNNGIDERNWLKSFIGLFSKD